MRFKHCISALACIAVLLLAVPKAFFMPADAAGEYTGETVRVGSVTLPLAEHMPGTYFTKNGSPCTCPHRRLQLYALLPHRREGNL